MKRGMKLPPVEDGAVRKDLPATAPEWGNGGGIRKGRAGKGSLLLLHRHRQPGYLRETPGFASPPRGGFALATFGYNGVKGKPFGRLDSGHYIRVRALSMGRDAGSVTSVTFCPDTVLRCGWVFFGQACPAPYYGKLRRTRLGLSSR